MDELDYDVYNADCPTRKALDRIADKWTALIIGLLAERPHRFGELRRRIDGISQKMLTQNPEKSAERRTRQAGGVRNRAGHGRILVDALGANPDRTPRGHPAMGREQYRGGARGSRTYRGKTARIGVGPGSSGPFLYARVDLGTGRP